MTHAIQPPVATAQMLIRRPVSEVFKAFVDPGITSRFWFSKSSGRLEVGKRIRWDWEMYGVFTNVVVKVVDRNKRILIEWNGPDNPSSVEWTFEPRGQNGTFVVIKNWAFAGDADKIVAEAVNSAGGFSFVLAGLKAFLEHGVVLNLIVDHDPASLVQGVKGVEKAGSMIRRPGISNRESADEEARDRAAHPPLNHRLPPVEDASGIAENPADLSREVHRGERTMERGSQQSHKTGVRSTAQKAAKSRHPDRPVPAATKVAGAFAKERARSENRRRPA